MVIDNSNKKLSGSHSRSHSCSNMSATSTNTTTDTTIATTLTSTTTGIVGGTNINTNNGKHSRRPSLTRKRSSQRLIKKIGIDLDDTVSFKDDYSFHSADSEGLEFMATNNSNRGNSTDIDIDLENFPRGNDNFSSKPNLPNLTSLKIYGGTQDDKKIHLSNSQNSLNFDVIEIPFVKARLDPSLPDDYLKDDILNIIQTLRIPKWYRKGYLESPLNRSKLILNKISGAMTNAIFKIQYQGLPSLLLRIYGKNNDSIIDRDNELQILARLSIQNIGPSLFGCFENGRFEQFLENATTLTKDDIRDWKISQRIARRMKELHSGIPLLKSEFENGPVSWQKIRKWLHIIEKHPNWINDNKRIQEIFNCQDWFSLKKNVRKYKEWLSKSSAARNSLVFCHNDTQYGNLLFSSPLIDLDSLSADQNSSIDKENTKSSTPADLTPASTDSLFPSTSNVFLDTIINPTKQDQIQDKKLVVIDFEYAGPNPASYDLANHFSEWMHDYSCSQPWGCNSSLFPTREQLLNFLYSYVSHLKSSSNANRKKTTKELDNEVRFFYNDVIKWRATVQLFWSLWSIIQSGELQKDDELLENQFDGINGEKYVITMDPVDKEAGNNTDRSDIILDKQTEQEEIEEDEETEGVNIDTFDYLKYCSDKISVFWGDLISLGVISSDDIVDINRVQWLDTEMI